ncbi:peptide deformylase [Corynebacterium sp. HMSC04H06]|uniref:peptide deformylase n=1 Tax=Corynebacterium sp. HMSC04H06 TaxID=1581050 RepID=UPI0008A3750C|nr:peptide deformylase [Corynebacterium sp. HMSC04H06]OFS22579.1 peptide deformylase [Corynebacterium sp. HMSC04H06]
MTLRQIRLFGDPVLNTAADAVTSFGPGLRALARDMLETMDEAGGVGLAANQVGVTQRVFVYDCPDGSARRRGVLVNPSWAPVLPGADGEAATLVLGREGCLSIPGVPGTVPRHERVVVSGTDEWGRPVCLLTGGLLARCIQHESDHLDGVLFLAHLSTEDRREAMAAIRSADWFNR